MKRGDGDGTPKAKKLKEKPKKEKPKLPAFPPYGHSADDTKPCFCRVCLEYWKEHFTCCSGDDNLFTEAVHGMREDYGVTPKNADTTTTEFGSNSRILSAIAEIS